MCEVPTCEDEGTRQLALDALEGSLQLGWDAGYGGGLLYMMDVLGKPMVDATVTKDGKLCEWLHLRTAYITLRLELLRGRALMASLMSLWQGGPLPRPSTHLCAPTR
jgi:hypothetical protein